MKKTIEEQIEIECKRIYETHGLIPKEIWMIQDIYNDIGEKQMKEQLEKKHIPRIREWDFTTIRWRALREAPHQVYIWANDDKYDKNGILIELHLWDNK
jgi:hypothetical protein